MEDTTIKAKINTSKDTNKYEYLIWAILFLSALIKLFFVIKVPADVFQNDAGTYDDVTYGHLGYLYHLYTYNKLYDFNPVGYWEIYHPPLHYFICAVFMHILSLFGASEVVGIEACQWLSVIYQSLMLVFINKIGKFFKADVFARALALILCAFLPYSTFLANSINNDPLSILLMIMALYYTLVWYENPKLSTIVKMALCVGLGMMTKLSVALVAFPMAFLMLEKLIRERKNCGSIIKQFLVFGLIAFPLGLWYQIWRFTQGMPLGYVPVCDPESAQYIADYSVVERFGHIKESLSHLYISFGAQLSPDINIPISLVKFATFSEYRDVAASYTTKASLAFWMVAVILILALVASVVLLIKKDLKWQAKVYFAILVVIMLGSYVKFCFDYPYVCTMNIRYIIPAVYIGFLAIGIVISNVLQAIRQKQKFVGNVLYGICFLSLGIFCIVETMIIYYVTLI